MKKLIQISKYFSDRYRNDPVASQWTSIDDCASPVGTGSVEFLEYWTVESAYVFDIIKIMVDFSSPELYISDLEYYGGAARSPNIVWRVGDCISIDNVEFIIRSCLRDHMWCRLYYKDVLFITFGHDMYVRVGINSDSDVKIHPSNQYVSHVDVSYDLNDEEQYYWGLEN